MAADRRQHRKLQPGTRATGAALLSILSTLVLSLGQVAALGAGAGEIAPSALAEIQGLEKEKAARTPAQQKMDSNLIHAQKKRLTGVASPAAPHLQPDVKFQADGRVLVDITAAVSAGLLSFIQQSGGEVLSSFAEHNSIRALVPLLAVETIAGRPDVRFVSRAHEPRTSASTVDPEGDICHEANLARTTFGADGTGVKVGVLSDGDDSNSVAVALGDLPPGVITLPGQSGIPSMHSEGTAMLEIVYRLAPGAQLYFATGSPTEFQMASNILALAAAGCKVIVDDITYPDESPFHEGQAIAAAVQTVSDQGVLYFSSAANNGNKDSGKSGTWEGDFADGGAVGAPISGVGKPGGGFESGRLHSFGGGTNYDAIAGTPSPAGIVLWWSDPLGASTNDYDLFILDSTGSSVQGVANTTQNGGSDPWEGIFTNLNSGYRIVIVKYSGDSRFLHLAGGQNFQLNISTSGNILGHNCSSAANAFCVAATPAFTADTPGDPTGPYPNPFTGGAANLVEVFSSDGPRRQFYYPDGTPITPGNFSSTGGRVLAKPDFTAADGVATTLSKLNPFFGTSCAAPHAAAIAALLLSYNPTLTPSQVRMALTNTALALTGIDSARTAGAGIIMAYQALASVSANGWTNPVSGKWEAGTNWSVGKAPNTFHTTVISNTPSKTVTIDATTSGSFPTNLTVLSLTVSAPTGSTNTLWLNNAGTAKALSVITGQGSSPASGDLTVDGNGVLAINHSVVGISSNLYVGNTSGNSLVVITNGSALTNTLGHVGFASSSGNNFVLVSGAGSVWTNRNNLELGESGPANGMTISNGGTVHDRIGNLGFNASSVSNTLLVTGSGSLWSNWVEVNIGVSGSGNSLVISNGAVVVDPVGLLGFNSSSSNNSVLVTGAGSVWNNQGGLFVGQNGPSNALTIANGGLVLATNVFISLVGNNPGNRMTVSGGIVYVTNGIGSGALDVFDGTLALNSGSVIADKLFVTNGANCVVQFNGGTLSSGGSSVINGQTLMVGNGSSGAAFNMIGGALPLLYGGIYSFANGLEIRSNAFLTGCGTINGSVTVDIGGTVQADCGDTLNFFGSVTNNGTITALNGTFINFYGSVVNSGVINGSGGNVQFFSTVQNSGTLVTNNMAAQPALTTLYSFTGGADGQSPYAGLVQASAGNFYGTTLYGGTNNYGAVFRITPAGAFTNLHSFAVTDGAYPYYAVLAQGSDGFLYGTTYSGGGPNGLGTVFKMSTGGALVWSYPFSGTDGSYPYAGLIQASDGYFYGTTFKGGTDYNPGSGDPAQGTVFRITSAGVFNSVHSLTLFDGLYPAAPLVQGSDGNFYGSTGEGGSGSGCLNNCGTIFKVTSGGALTPLVGSASNPRGGFVQGSDGLIYGAVSGVSEVPARLVRNDGKVFRMTSAGVVTVLHAFTNFVGEGANPYAGMVQGSDGNFYGTTQKGGIANTGTVFRVTTSGALTTVYNFAGGGDGGAPNAPLVQGIDGNFYGTTTFGGAYGYGTVFKLSVYLIPPTNQLARITGIQLAGTNVAVALTSIAGKGYQLQYRTSLGAGNWSNVIGGATNGIGGPILLNDHAGPLPPQRFYRVVITP